MPSSITATNINDVKIYSHTNATELPLCPQHCAELGNKVATAFNALVATQLFQTHFRDFLPTGHTTVNVNINVTPTTITVKKLAGPETKTLNLSTLQDSGVGEVMGINAKIIRKADKAYRACQAGIHSSSQGAHGHAGTGGPLNGFNGRQGQHSSHEAGSGSSIGSFEAGTQLLHSEVDQLRRTTLSNQSTQKVERIEELLKTWEAKLGLTPLSENPTDPNARLASIESRLRTIDAKIAEKSKSPSPNPSSSHTPENAFAPNLGIHRSEIPANIFNPLLSMSEELASPTYKDELNLPEIMATQFSSLSSETRNAIFHETFNVYCKAFCCSPETIDDKDPQLGEKLFLGQHRSIPWTNLNRAHAIRYYLSSTLGNGFFPPHGYTMDGEEQRRRFKQLFGTQIDPLRKLFA